MKPSIGQLLCAAFNSPKRCTRIVVDSHHAKLVRVTITYYPAPLKIAANRRTIITRTIVRTFSIRSRSVRARLAQALKIK